MTEIRLSNLLILSILSWIQNLSQFKPTQPKLPAVPDQKNQQNRLIKIFKNYKIWKGNFLKKNFKKSQKLTISKLSCYDYLLRFGVKWEQF